MTHLHLDLALHARFVANRPAAPALHQVPPLTIIVLESRQTAPARQHVPQRAARARSRAQLRPLSAVLPKRIRLRRDVLNHLVRARRPRLVVLADVLAVAERVCKMSSIAKRPTHT